MGSRLLCKNCGFRMDYSHTVKQGKVPLDIYECANCKRTVEQLIEPPEGYKYA